MDGLTTFSATNFFYYSLPFKVIDQRTPPPYDSTSALHGLTTFQKPTTTLSGDMAILPSFGYYFYFLCSEMSVKIFIKCALANKNSYNTTNCALWCRECNLKTAGTCSFQISLVAMHSESDFINVPWRFSCSSCALSLSYSFFGQYVLLVRACIHHMTSVSFWAHVKIADRIVSYYIHRFCDVSSPYV